MQVGSEILKLKLSLYGVFNCDFHRSFYLPGIAPFETMLLIYVKKPALFQPVRMSAVQAVSQLKKVEKDRRILRFGPE